MARKSKGFGESIKSEENKNLEHPKQKVKKSAFGELLEDKDFNSHSKEKMSDILKEFIAPYARFRENFEQYDTFLDLAVAAWNLALFPAEEVQSLIDELIDGLIDKLGENIKHEREIEKVLNGQELFREIIEELVERKRSHYPDYDRYIVEWNLQKVGNEYRISVVSTPVSNL